MNCKNCATEIDSSTSFCHNCGAKIIKERITIKFIILQLLESFGWDSVFFFTIKKMFFKPNIVISEYINGTRKRYVKPFSYLIIGVAIYLTFINFFKDDLNIINNVINKSYIEAANKDLSELKNISEEELLALKRDKRSAQIGLKFGEYTLKYFNFIALLFIPFFAFMSKWTYKKPYNYGEHIVINTYLYGTSMYISILFFFLAKFINPKIYFFTNLAFLLFYLYAFTKLYNHTFKQALLKLLRFLLVFIILFLIIIFIGGLGVFLYMVITKG